MKPGGAVAISAGLVLCVGGGAAAEAPAIQPSTHPPGIPYVASRSDIVRDLLWMAEVSTNDVVYDLGSGDGRVVIAAVKEFGARRAVGIESDTERYRQSVEAARQAGVTNQVEFIQGDLFTNDVSEASVVVLYLGHDANLRLRPSLLRALKPGSRIVSHQYTMGEWPPDKQLKVRTPYLGMYGIVVGPFTENPNVPDYRNTDTGLFTTLSMWVVPARLAGVWRSSMDTRGGPAELELMLQQRLGQVSGRFKVTGATNVQGWLRADVWGTHLRFEGQADQQPYFGFRLRFDGHAEGDRLKGHLAVFEEAGMRETRLEAQRERSDLTGIWQWPAADDSTNITLHLEREHGALTAIYNDGHENLAVTDIYDLGGGFYFTLCLGREELGPASHAWHFDKGCGWLLGDGAMAGNVLKGTLSVYPYLPASRQKSHPMFGPAMASTNEAAQTLPTDRRWEAKRGPK